MTTRFVCVDDDTTRLAQLAVEADQAVKAVKTVKAVELNYFQVENSTCICMMSPSIESHFQLDGKVRKNK